MFGLFFDNPLNIVHLPGEFFYMFLGIQNVVIFTRWRAPLQFLHILQRQSEIALTVTAKTLQQRWWKYNRQRRRYENPNIILEPRRFLQCRKKLTEHLLGTIVDTPALCSAS